MNARTPALVLACVFLATAARASGAPIWTPDPEAPGKFRLDRKTLSAELARAPREFTEEAAKTVVTIPLPRPDGTLARFRVEESPILPPSLSAKYGIRTWIGRSVDEPGAIARFSLGPDGFNALVLAPSGSVLIRPSGVGEESHAAIRYEDDPLNEAVRCVAPDEGIGASKAGEAGPSVRSTAGTVSIYHMAASATGEFTAQNGGTVASAFTAITNVINAVNTIYRRDFGVHLELLEESEQVIQTEPSSYLPSGDRTCEGAVDCLSPDCLQDGNQCLLDGTIGTDNYDVGVIFDAANPDGSAAGAADLYAVCDPLNKGR
ncbi:MAG TPA: zinc-dependent metalloprotease family protein, partial [Candidatus Polarisedimenticolaceae bacterium]